MQSRFAYPPTSALPVILCTADPYVISDQGRLLESTSHGGDPQTIRHCYVGLTGQSDASENGDAHCVGALPSHSAAHLCRVTLLKLLPGAEYRLFKAKIEQE